jgi:hypothetical protein
MRYVAWLFGLFAMTIVANEAAELARFRHADWPWLVAMVAALLAIELVELRVATAGLGSESGRLILRLWVARATLIAALAVLRVDVNVIRGASEELHRGTFREEIGLEMERIRAADKVWLAAPVPPRPKLVAAAARESRLAACLRYLDETQDVDQIAVLLDRDPSKLAREFSPLGGYSGIVARKVKISNEMHLREWTNHINELAGEMFWLLLPYLLASTAFCAFDATVSKNSPRPDTPLPGGPATPVRTLEANWASHIRRRPVNILFELSPVREIRRHRREVIVGDGTEETTLQKMPGYGTDRDQSARHEMSGASTVAACTSPTLLRLRRLSATDNPRLSFDPSGRDASRRR